MDAGRQLCVAKEQMVVSHTCSAWSKTRNAMDVYAMSTDLEEGSHSVV